MSNHNLQYRQDSPETILDKLIPFSSWVAGAVAFITYVVAYILLSLGKIDTHVFAATSIALFLGFFFLIIETVRRIKRLILKVEQLISSKESSGLYPFSDCFKDLVKRLSRLQDSEKIIIDCFAIDMTTAWDNVMNILRKEQMPPMRVELRFLVLTSNPEEIQPSFQDLEYWCDNTKLILDTVSRQLQNENARLAKEGKQLKVSIKQYAAIPVIHGFRLKSPFEEILYVSFCRWVGQNFNTYDWGQEKFHIITSEKMDSNLSDLSQIFNAHFNHYWINSEKPTIEKFIGIED